MSTTPDPAMPVVALAELKRLLSYDPETGEFRWLVYRGRRAKAGQRAGSVNWTGYRRVYVNGRAWLAHRLAYLFVHGELPDAPIDHINCERDDNSARNLRVGPTALNNQNVRRPRKQNLLGALGVMQSGAKFRAGIQVNGKKLYLGTFSTIEEASAAYLKAKREMHQWNSL